MRDADRRRVSGVQLGMLHGLPIPVKDSVNTKALPTSFAKRAGAKGLRLTSEGCGRLFALASSYGLQVGTSLSRSRRRMIYATISNIGAPCFSLTRPCRRAGIAMDLRPD